MMRHIEGIHLLIVPSLVFGPLSTAFVALGVVERGPLPALGAFVVGVLFWTLGEYLVHRFVQHGRVRKGEYIENHGRHHADPRTAHHFVYSLRQTLPFVVPVFAGFWLLFRDPWYALAATGGNTCSYLVNEWVHFLAHRPELVEGRPLLRRLVRNHLRHHDEDARRHFGFFTSFWDRVFGTN
jgi:dihydroceramide fatty acyl 2-hydroxylase